MSPLEIEQLIRLTGTNETEISHQCEILRVRASSRQARYESLSVRRNRAFVRMQCLEEEVRETPEGDRLKLLQHKYRKQAERFDRARREAVAVLRTPTHREIADTLGVPKGSVDSGIFYLRNTMDRRKGFRGEPDSRMLSS
jgi:hypothetical protein